MKNILLFSPHPDDNLCVAGAVRKLQKKGYQFYEILFANGDSGGNLKNSGVITDIRDKEFEKASDILNTVRSYKIGFSDDEVQYSKKLFYNLIEIIREIQPAIAFLPHPDDYHRDHKEVSSIAYDAIRAADNSFKFELGHRYRIPVSLYYQGLNPLNQVNILVDIEEEFDFIMKLVRVYSSQMTERMKQNLISKPSLAGYYMRVRYAEAYEIPKNLPLYPNGVLSDLS
ncbi:hypothetical protein GF357_04580 [Candidatus Dojkabacteria bacterium]|nr:hypothetical protein [Candidatus Dojkabacteria bacterium]